MATITTFYLHSAQVSYTAPQPSGFLGAWDQTATAGAVLGQAMDGNSGSAQTAINPTWASALPRNTTQSMGHLQCISQFLAPQTIAAANWTVGFGAALTNAASSHTWSGFVFIGLVNGATGALRTTILATTAAGATARTTAAERSCYATTLAGSAATASAGDYLVVEIGLQVHSTSVASFTPSSDTYQDGTIAITSDSTTITSAQSFVTAPQAIVLNDYFPFKQYNFYQEW